MEERANRKSGETTGRNTEAELQAFRERWREEVSARARAAGESTAVKASTDSTNKNWRPTPLSTEILNEDVNDSVIYDDFQHHNEYIKDATPYPKDETESSKTPHSALEHYEKAVERENLGKLGDSVTLYRKAFKLDSGVHEAYKKKHFPPSAPSIKPANSNPSNAAVTVPNPAHHSLEGGLKEIDELMREFSELSIPSESPPTDMSPVPPCPIAVIPEEILVEILMTLAIKDVAAFAKSAQICKRFAYLVGTEERIWKRIVLGNEFGFKGMHYNYACDLHGQLVWDAQIPEPKIERDLTPTIYESYRSQFRRRPRIRFSGCYISTVNYTRPGVAQQSRVTWNSPVHIVTYFRYLRFFRDGTLLSLLTTVEPADVVHHLTKKNLHDHHSVGLPSAFMKDALPGRWRLSGPGPLPFDAEDAADVAHDIDAGRGPGEYLREPLISYTEEEEGDVHVETEGVIPKYLFKMQFALGSSGRKDGARNNKLSWKGFWSYNRLTDDWGEFGLKNDRAFYWSRVKSYGIGE